MTGSWEDGGGGDPKGVWAEECGAQKEVHTLGGGGEGDCRGKIRAVPRPGRQGGATPQEDAPLPQLVSSSCL